ncbi:hypothetical protein IH970_06095 [candidate division KSB1 bacterium]|nr:hypothetical protein [candidate division KSB1 bacterium]
MIRLSLRFAFLIILLAGCATTSNIKKEDRVTILLKDGTKIEGQVTDIFNSTIAFEAIDRKKAYDYGEVIQLNLVRGIRMPNGEILSVKEYDAVRKADEPRVLKRRSKGRVAKIDRRVSKKSSESQYKELENKPVSEMTDNEFQFFMMMKEKELETEKEFVAQKPEVTIRNKNTSRQFDRQLDELVDSMISAGVAPNYLGYLKNKAEQRRGLTRFEKEIINLIESHPTWQDQVDDLDYLNRTAKKALSRAYLYNPDELEQNLKLSLDQDADMDYVDLVQQLHRQFGEDVGMRDFRILVEVLGESGAGAVKEILENYSTWQFVLSQKSYSRR